MSRRSTNPATTVAPPEAKPGDVLALRHRDAFVATRYALPAYHLGQMRHAVRSKLVTKPGMRFYRVDGLGPERRAELFALLDRQGCRYEVWR